MMHEGKFDFDSLAYDLDLDLDLDKQSAGPLTGASHRRVYDNTIILKKYYSRMVENPELKSQGWFYAD